MRRVQHQSLLELCGEFLKSLVAYAAILEKKVQRAARSFTLDSATTIGFVLNSVEYCAETVPQLEDMIVGKIDAAYKDRVDFEDAQDAFYGNIASAVSALVGGIMSSASNLFSAMVRMPWGTWSDVGDQSAVNEVGALVRVCAAHSQFAGRRTFKTFATSLRAPF